MDKLNPDAKISTPIVSWPFLKVLAQEAQKHLGKCRVGLFGSRATDKYRENSDFDIAIDHNSSQEKWAEFVLFVKESPVTLYRVDLIDLKLAPPQLLQAIRRDWISLNDN